jgi:Uma2 family endonuclease
MATGLHELETRLPAHVGLDEDKLYEVVDGHVVEKPPIGARQSILATFLAALMDPVARSSRLGRVAAETLFLIDPDRKLKRRPDVAFVSAQRWPFKREVPDVEGWDVIPDLTVEVVSKSNSAAEVGGKIGEYFQAGVTRVWVIYPSLSKIYVYDAPNMVRILQLGDALDGEAIVPGFRVPLTTLFASEEETETPDQSE